MSSNPPLFTHVDTSDWTTEDHFEQSIGGYWCQHAEQEKDIYVNGCRLCDPDD